MTTTKEFVKKLIGRKIVDISPMHDDPDMDCADESFEVLLDDGYCFMI